MTHADWQQQARDEYAASFPKKLATIETLSAQWLESPDSLPRFESLRTAVHRIHGTAGSYGFDELGEIAEQWDDAMTAALKSNTHASRVTIDAVERHLAAFRIEIGKYIAR